MSLDPNAINTSIRNVIRTIFAMPDGSVRPNNQDGMVGQMDQPFALVLITRVEKVGQDSRTLADEGVEHQLTETIEGMREVDVDIQFFNSAAPFASRLDGVLRLQSSQALLRANNLSYCRCSHVGDLSQVVDDYWEQRNLVSVTFYATSTETATISTFASATIEVQTETANSTSEVNLDS